MVWYGVAGRVYSYVKIVHNRNTGLQKYAKHPKKKQIPAHALTNVRAARNGILDSLPNGLSF